MKKIIALAAFAAVSASASAATNLIKDGSFESISQAAGTWAIYAAVPNWQVAPATGNDDIAGLEIRNNVAGVAEDGKNFIELDGNENDLIAQTFNTNIGQQYQITFWYADRVGVAASSLGFEANVASGSTVVELDKGAYGDNGAKWHEATINFVANSKHTTFSIAAAGTSDSYGTSFDNFTAMAVPEPGTLGLFAAGLAVLGMSARRRRPQ